MSKVIKLSSVFMFCLWLQGCALHATEPFDGAIFNGDTDKVRSLIDAGEHLTFRGPGGFTPLHTAARWGDPEIVKLLLEAGSDVNARSNALLTPLSWAVRGQDADRAEVIRLLVVYKAEINTLDSLSNRTPLENAYKNPNNVRALLLAGADPIASSHPNETVKEHYQNTFDLYVKKGWPHGQAEIIESIKVLDEFSAPFASLKRCENLSLEQQTSCYSKHIAMYSHSKTSDAAKQKLEVSKQRFAQYKKDRAEKTRLESIRLAKATKEKAARMEKRLADQACRLKSDEWIYLSKNCKQGLAHGQGEAINDTKGLKFIGEFKQGQRIQGELYASDLLMYDGSLKDGRPHGVGICMHDGEPEECKFYKGKRTDVLFKQRLEFAKQSEMMAEREARMTKSLESSEQRINDRLSSIDVRSSDSGYQSNGSSITDYAVDSLKKKAADKAVDALFDSLF